MEASEGSPPLWSYGLGPVVRFYGRLQKSFTKVLRRLHGSGRLEIWLNIMGREGRGVGLRMRSAHAYRGALYGLCRGMLVVRTMVHVSLSASFVCRGDSFNCCMSPDISWELRVRL